MDANANTPTPRAAKLQAQIDAMEQSCLDDPICVKAVELCEKLFTLVKAGAEGVGLTVTDAAKRQLEKHYKKQFYYALAVRKAPLDAKAMENLTLKATFLALAAADHATNRGSREIEPQDVHQASFIVDCPAEPPASIAGRLRMFYDFCS